MRRKAAHRHAAATVLVGALLALPVRAAEDAPRLLDKAPAGPPLHHVDYRVRLDADSIKSGWVVTEQCHRNLGALKLMEVVFAPDKVRRLKITRAEHIGSATIKGPTVQLEAVSPQSVLCIASENKALTRDANTGQITWRGGPWMRTIFDGYFAMRVTLRISYPANALRFNHLDPKELRPRLRHTPGRLSIDSIFQGRLYITATFADTRRTKAQ